MVKSRSGISEWLNRECQSGGLSLRQAAEKTGLSHATIRDIISGTRPSAETIHKLAHGFAQDQREKLALEDSLLILAGYRTERPEEEFSQPLARLMDIVSDFSESQLKLMQRFAEFLATMEKES